METSKITRKLADLTQSAATTKRLFTEIIKLDADRSRNLANLQARLSKLDESISALRQAIESTRLLNEWLEGYRNELLMFKQERAKRFGIELARELGEIGLQVTGHYPELRTGVFTLEIDVDKWRVTLWYGPKQESLDTCALSPKEARELVQRSRAGLGSRVEEAVFVQRLQEALGRVRYLSDEDGTAPIIAVLGELALLMQSGAFRRDPRREHYRSYGRADLSTDLCRFKRRVELRTATRTLARSREAFLWVPSDESLEKGAIYSHVRLRKETP